MNYYTDGFFLRKAEFCAEVGAKGIQGIDLISFGEVRLRVELCHGPGDDRPVKPEVTGKPEVIRKTAITATPNDKTWVKIVL